MRPRTEPPILDRLIATAVDRIGSRDADAAILRGLWKSEYVLRLSDVESSFHLHYLVAQTVGQGCSYYVPTSHEPRLSRVLLGTNVLETRFESRAVTIATLDAVFSSLNPPPASSFVLDGSNVAKSVARAELIAREADGLLAARPPRSGDSHHVVLVGVVGSLLHALGSRGWRLSASDADPAIVGGTVHGVVVAPPSATIELVARADLAIVTGMTLATGALDDILATALARDTALVIFAETGANFAAEYCSYGADVVVSEPLPFYLTGAGPSQIGVYRSAGKSGSSESVSMNFPLTERRSSSTR